MPKEDLDAVFMPGEDDMAEEDPGLPPVDDGGDEEALDMAIDEAFDATDPAVRREAFKNAVRLCSTPL
jgi:hypothetical protein